jgi:alpha-beta hydrolase superfamily lysophospholipase
MGQVASLLRNGQNSGVLQTLWRTCAQQLKDEKLAVRCHALRGFGALAKARAKDDLSKIWQQLVQQVKKILVQIARSGRFAGRFHCPAPC